MEVKAKKMAAAMKMCHHRPPGRRAHWVSSTPVAPKPARLGHRAVAVRR